MTLLLPLDLPRPRSASPPRPSSAPNPPREPSASCPPSQSSSPASPSPPPPTPRSCSTSYSARASSTAPPSPPQCSRSFSPHLPSFPSPPCGRGHSRWRMSQLGGRRGRQPPPMFSPSPVVWYPPSPQPLPHQTPQACPDCHGRGAEPLKSPRRPPRRLTKAPRRRKRHPCGPRCLQEGSGTAPNKPQLSPTRPHKHNYRSRTKQGVGGCGVSL